MKAAIPYMPQKGTKTTCRLCKIQRVIQPRSFFHSPQPELSIMSVSPVQPEEMLNDMKKYASDYTRNQIDQLLFALNTIQLLQMLRRKFLREVKKHESGLDEPSRIIRNRSGKNYITSKILSRRDRENLKMKC